MNVVAPCLSVALTIAAVPILSMTSITRVRLVHRPRGKDAVPNPLDVSRRQERGAHRVGVGRGVAAEVRADDLVDLPNVGILLRVTGLGEDRRGDGGKERERTRQAGVQSEPPVGTVVVYAGKSQRTIAQVQDSCGPSSRALTFQGPPEK